jgi:hypothetical protein
MPHSPRDSIVTRHPMLDPAIGEHPLPAAMRRHLPSAETRDGVELTRTGLLRARRAAVARAEHEFLVALLEKWPSNLSQAARASGIGRGYLQRLLSKHQLRYQGRNTDR